jgi:hypothetical protein
MERESTAIDPRPVRASNKNVEVYHSKSLYNYVLCPGWHPREAEILRNALMKYGIGRWVKISESKCLPNKSISQMYNQTQRFLGQQSLAEFMQLHVDLFRVWETNQAKIDVVRKGGLIINVGDNPTKASIFRKREANKKKFGLSLETVNKIRLPRYEA